MPTTTNEGVTLSYEIDEPEGDTTGPTVAFVEGLGYGRWMWRWQREVFPDHTQVLWDNRGTGESDAPEGPYTVPEMASDMEAVLDAAGVDDVHVVGASMGGMIAQRYAIDYDRAASLSLLCTSPGGEEAVPTPDETLTRMFNVPEEYDEREAIRHKMRPAMTDEFFDSHEDLIERIIDWRLGSDAPPHAREAQGAAVQAFDASDELDAVDVPAQVLHGTADRVVPVENADLLHSGLPDSELDLFEGGPHLFFVQMAEAVNDSVRSFVEDVHGEPGR